MSPVPKQHGKITSELDQTRAFVTELYNNFGLLEKSITANPANINFANRLVVMNADLKSAIFQFRHLQKGD